MKKIRNKEIRDVDECLEKIEAILKEYNCCIETDEEITMKDGSAGIIVLDIDNHQYALIE